MNLVVIILIVAGLMMGYAIYKVALEELILEPFICEHISPEAIRTDICK